MNEEDFKYSKDMKIEVSSVRLFRTLNSTDTIIFDIDGPSPFPKWIPKLKPRLELAVESGYGEIYCKTVFGIEPEIIDIGK